MPTLALLAACDRAIIEADTKSVSLIALFTTLKVTIPADDPPPSNAAAPREWSIAAGWEPNEGDEGKQFTQCIDMFLPDGKIFIEKSQLKFTMEKGKRHYNTTKILGFPIGQPGKCEVRVWVELDAKPVTEKSSLFLGIEHELVSKPRSPVPIERGK